MKKLNSLSGIPIANVSHADRVLCAIADTKAQALTCDADSVKMIGPINAMLIVNELRAQGYEIVIVDQQQGGAK